MIDLKRLINEFDSIKEILLIKGAKEEFLIEIKNKFLENKKLINKLNKFKQEKNILDKKKGNYSEQEQKKKLKKKIQNLIEKVKKTENELFKISSSIPNIPNKNIPKTKDITVNEVLYSHDKKHDLKHEEILKRLDFLDEKASINLCGSRFVVYKNGGSVLLRSLINFMLSENYKDGYSIYDAPYLVKKHNLYNTGQLPKFEKDLFKVENDYFLIPTAEVTLTNIFQGEIILEKNIPKKITGYSPCFRLEAGAAGQENKGLIRLHQFNKVEIIQIANPVNSYESLQSMIKTASKILDILEISYRIIDINCSNLGFSSSRTYDIEIWMPNTEKWLEISSCSNCEDFQSRRAKIRVKKENGEKYYPHTLNASSLAIDRLIIAICEYYYNEKENKLLIPEKLKQYFFL